MSNTFYSVNDEDFRFHEIEEAMEYAFEEFKHGGKIVVYEGRLKRELASHYFRAEPLEDMRDNAYGEVGEYCDTWPDTTSEQEKELEGMIKATIDQWATRHDLHPDFGLIENVKRRAFVEIKESEEFEMENFMEIKL